jgi:hypothetical protein
VTLGFFITEVETGLLIPSLMIEDVGPRIKSKASTKFIEGTAKAP